MDAFGHINNVAYFRYLENGRLAYFDEMGKLFMKRSPGGMLTHFVNHAEYVLKLNMW